jgi:hypothetical protein
MNKTLEQLKYRLKKNKYITDDHVRGVIREVDELNQEPQTVAHLLDVAQRRKWLGKVDDAGFYPSLIFSMSALSENLGRDQENRLWLMCAVPVDKVQR